MGELLTGHIGTNENIGDLATKVLYGQKRWYLVSQLLYDIYDEQVWLQFFNKLMIDGEGLRGLLKYTHVHLRSNR